MVSFFCLLFLLCEKEGRQSTTFRFDNVLGAEQSQAEMFAAVEDVALSVLEMHNVCVFAYGSTGSGKTYSMQGPPSVVTGGADASEWGLYPRIVDAIFAAIAQREASDVGMCVDLAGSLQCRESASHARVLR